jgi:hypothetical protein
MVRLSRYILVLVTTLTLSAILPQLWWMALDKPIRKPFIMYSCIENDFLIRRIDGNTRWEDTHGNQYSREEYEERLPFLNVRQLMISGKMKDTINGVALDPHEMNMNWSVFSFKPADMQTPDPGLWPLIESESGRASLEMPEDFFRITWRMEFIHARSNQIIEDKSRKFSAALYNRGFEFPASMVAGIPTTRKSCDEGYFIIDSRHQLFHLKMIKGDPYVRKVDLPDEIRFRHMACVDLRDKKYYAYLFDSKGDIHILTQEEYKLVKLPVGNFHPEREELRIYGDLFHYNVILSGEGFIRDVVLDKEYDKVTEYNETWPVRAETASGLWFAGLFPFQLSLSDDNSNYHQFNFTFSKGFLWLSVSVVLLILHVIRIRKRRNFIGHVPDLVLILLTGIYGFIAVNIFQNKFFK